MCWKVVYLFVVITLRFSSQSCLDGLQKQDGPPSFGSQPNPCSTEAEAYDLSSCPPGYAPVSEFNNRYCFQVNAPASWSFPCLTSGGASVITDLSSEEFGYLLKYLNDSHTHKQYWLPAQRRKMFTPVVWNIPGPNWGQIVDLEELNVFSSLIRNCLMLDVDKQIITTETCSRVLPSVCIYINDVDHSTKCPDGYYGFRFMSDNGTCFGIEYSDNSTGFTFNQFLDGKCYKPMGDNTYDELTKFLFLKIADMDHKSKDEWCWFKTAEKTLNTSKLLDVKNISEINNKTYFQIVLNNNGTMGILNELNTLKCMACEAKVTYNGQSELQLEFIPDELKLYLTVYFPSGLWRYNSNDIGVQCFSDAKGFIKPIYIDHEPFTEIKTETDEDNFTSVEKIVYEVDLITNRSAQYWCEAHNKTFSLLTSSKIVANNPKTNSLHVFALVVKLNVHDNETLPDLCGLVHNLTDFFKAQTILIMDIYEYTVEGMLILLHLHVKTLDMFEDETENLIATYDELNSKAIEGLYKYDVVYINMLSSIYCLPTTSYDNMLLEWDLTKIGEVTAPKQFCLQSNGLPVRRHCLGSYLVGGTWSEVEGRCNETYEPSVKTTFLYNFVKGHISKNFSSRFLTDGLEFVLDDIEMIIPADIYYLSMSLQHVINMVQANETSVEMGDIANMAWAIDRIMLIDREYLRLSQTFNSTNVILDSVNDIIEKLTYSNSSSTALRWKDEYQLSVRPRFVIQVSYPLQNNITGLALIRKNESNSFADMVVLPLYANTTIRNILQIRNLEVATWVPLTALQTLQRNKNNTKKFYKEDVHVVASIYYNDGVFQQLDPSKRVINSRIIGLTIPGFKTNLIHSIPLLFKEFDHHNLTKICGYWDFHTREMGRNPGFWSNTGCYYYQSWQNISVCKCYHMTHFGQLIDIGDLKKPGARPQCHTKALNIITLVGSFLSLFGIVGIWITALVFQTWRKKPGTKVLLQLSTAISMPLLLIIVFNLDDTIFYEKDGTYGVLDDKKLACIFLGALMQYSILASFTWMLITAVLQFIRYVRVLGVCRPSRFMCKFTLVGWGIPVLPVVVVLVADAHNYIPEPSIGAEKGICYPKGIFLLVGIILPITSVLVINIVLFISVIFSISRGPEGKMKTSDLDLIKTQLRLSLFLFFLLGLTWIFGIFSFSNNLIWSYLFCLTSTLQGFVLFVYFVICDPATRNLWITLMKPQFKSSSSRKSVTSISSS